MKHACSVSDLRSRAPAWIRQAQQNGSVTLCRNGKVVGFLISRDRMEAILETLEIMANPKAMKAIRDYEAGKVKMLPVSALDED